MTVFIESIEGLKLVRAPTGKLLHAARFYGPEHQTRRPLGVAGAPYWATECHRFLHGDVEELPESDLPLCQRCRAALAETVLRAREDVEQMEARLRRARESIEVAEAMLAEPEVPPSARIRI